MEDKLVVIKPKESAQVLALRSLFLKHKQQKVDRKRKLSTTDEPGAASKKARLEDLLGDSN
jgi:uncharacterized protein YaeQ